MLQWRKDARNGNRRSRLLRRRLPWPINRPMVQLRRKLHRCLRHQPSQTGHLRQCWQDHRRKALPETRSNEPDSGLTLQLPAWQQLRRRVLPSSTNLRHRQSSTWRIRFQTTRKSQILALRTLKTSKSLPATIATNTCKPAICPRKVTPSPSQRHPTICSKPTTAFHHRVFPATFPVSSSRNQPNHNQAVTTSRNLHPASIA